MPVPDSFELHQKPLFGPCREPGFLGDISPRALKSFEAISQVCLYPAAAVLFAETQTPRGVYLLDSGRAKMTMTSAEGKAVILRITGPGEMLGLGAAITEKPYEITAETLEPCRVRFAKTVDFCCLVRKDPELSLKVIEQLSREYFAACKQVRTLALSRRATEKVARFLLDWAARGRVANQIPMTLPLTHEEIAQAVGLSRETVTRTLSAFRHRKLIAMAGPDILICNRPALETLTAA